MMGDASMSGLPVRVVVVNDYELVVRGLAAMLEPFSDQVVIVGEVSSDVPMVSADIALFDTFAAHRSARERIREMAADVRIGKVVLYSWDFAEGLAPSPTVDVDAVVSKELTGAELAQRLVHVHQGGAAGAVAVPPLVNGPELSQREREVLFLIGRGRTNKQIAAELFVTVETVKTHVRSVLRKLGATSRAQAAVLAGDLDLV